MEGLQSWSCRRGEVLAHSLLDESSKGNLGVKEGYLAGWQKICILILALPLPSWLILLETP